VTAFTVEEGAAVAQRTPQAVFLDLDGCLVDSRAAISHCLNVGLEAVGAAPRRARDLYHLIGPPLHESFVALLAEQEVPVGRTRDELAARCVDAYREAYVDVSLSETHPVEGIDGALERLGARSTLAVVTSKPAEFAVPILSAVGLEEWFVAVHAPSLTARAEPKALTLARALVDVVPGLPPGGTVMVGDRHHDVDAGRACGTRTVGVTWGIGAAEELAHADRVVGSPDALVGAVLD
jgi:phosphoglycolate phosphatase